MNLVLADTEEFRRVKRKAAKSTAPGAASSSALTETEEKRTLGLTIVRGAHIISLSVESPPPADPSARLGASAPGGVSAALAAGAGVARPAGRGAAVGLAVCLSQYLFWNWANEFYRDLLLVLVVHPQDLVASLELHRLEEEARKRIPNVRPHTNDLCSTSTRLPTIP
jgi:small nuclear ribonucleoprotein B and B'